MDPSQIRESLPWFLNGTLEESERATVANALREQPELREELAETWLAGQTFGQRIPTEEVVAYVFGEETMLDPKVIESLADPEEVAMVRASLAALRDEASQPAEERSSAGHPSAGRPSAGHVVPFERPVVPAVATVRPNYLPAALAAGLMSLIAFTAWFMTWQGQRQDLLVAESRLTVAESQIQALNQTNQGLEVGLDRVARMDASAYAITSTGDSMPSYVLDNAVRRNATPDQKFSLPAAAETVSFFLRAPTTAREISDLQLRFADSEGHEVERIVDLSLPPNNEIMVAVPAAAFAPGTYQVELRSGESDSWRVLETYRLEIVQEEPATDG